MNATDARRWALVQAGGGLNDLPAGYRDLKSSLEGHGFPRNVVLTFTAPRSAVKAWVLGSPGFTTYQEKLKKIDSYRRQPLGVVAPLISTAATQPAVQAGAETPAWPAPGFGTVYYCSSDSGPGCSVSIHSTGVDTVWVRVSRHARGSNF